MQGHVKSTHANCKQTFYWNWKSPLGNSEMWEGGKQKARWQYPKIKLHLELYLIPSLSREWRNLQKALWMSQLLGVKEGSRANGSLLIIHRFCISSPEIAHSISYLYDIFSSCAYYIRDSLSSEIVETAVMGSNQVHPYPPYIVASFFFLSFFLSLVIKIRSFCLISSS